MRFAKALFLGGLVAGGLCATAQAQYYDATPRPYYEPPPPGYYRPPPPRRALGGRCDARLPRSPQRVVCPIVRPRPLGRPCICPPPPPPPGYPPGPYLNGRVVP